MWAGGQVIQPFQSGIAEFPAFDNIPNASTTVKQYLTVLQASGCCNITCLRMLSSEEYANAQQKVLNDSAAYPPGLSYFGPSVDGKILGDLPSKELQAGHISQLPIMFMRDGNEGLSFTHI
jgi:carboxylesterase type B